MRKILFTANTKSHIELFHLPYIEYFKKLGYEVHIACPNSNDINIDCKKIPIDFTKRPISLKNIKAYFKLRKLILTEKYNLINTNTPSASAITRISSIKSRKKNNTKVIYIAHGFHFYKGCHFIRWIIYYQIEKYLSKFTDLIINLNKEDYEITKKKFCCDNKLINGIGFDQNKFNKVSKSKIKTLKEELNINDSDYVITYIAEVSKRKNQRYLLKCISKIDFTNYKLLLAGYISDKKIYKYIKKYNLNDKVLVLGFRNDINEILEITNLVVSTSKHEGLPLNIIEAMYKEKDIIVSNVRGNNDLIKNNVNGYTFDLSNPDKLVDLINYCYKNPDNKKYKEYNKKKVNIYTNTKVLEEIKKIYVKY